jgi:hypothetical protein
MKSWAAEEAIRAEIAKRNAEQSGSEIDPKGENPA